jgi:hypothetical protein
MNVLKGLLQGDDDKSEELGTEISEDEMRNINPDYLLVLPWHFREEFIKRESKYLENGGSLIFPLPTVEIITN